MRKWKTLAATNNRRQNELRHFSQNWAFLGSTNFKRRKYSFCSPIPSMQCCADVRLPIENNRHPNFEWRGQGTGADSFVLQTYPVWIQCLNNFVADWRWKLAAVKKKWTISSIKRVTRKFLEVSGCSFAKQRQRNVQKKVCCTCKVAFLLIRPIDVNFTVLVALAD